MIHIELAPPQIEHDTIRFSWCGNAGLPEPPDGGLFYRYEGIDLNRFSNELWMEIFLSLRLRALRMVHEPVHLELPCAVPQPVVDFWRTYHAAENVTVTPISSESTYHPWSETAAPLVDKHIEAAMFFGGGRDSLSAACVLGEIYGRDKVLLLQCVDPHRPGESRRRQVADRSERLSLTPLHEELGFPVQRVWTNLHALTMEAGGRKAEPHIEQYTAGMLPVILTYGIPFTTMGLPWGEYLIIERKGIPFFRYDLSRPEILTAQSRHYRTVAGIDYHPRNISLALNGVISFTLLAHRYADAFPHILSCQPSSQSVRWCHGCAKCARYALSCLHEGVEPTEFNLNRFFGKSPWIRKVVDSVKGKEAPPPGENLAWQPGWCASGAYQGYCSAFYHSELDFAGAHMAESAFYNFLLAKSMYGNLDHPINRVSPAEAYALLPADLADELAKIVGTVADIEPLGNKRIETGDGVPTWGPFALPFTHPLLDLPHIAQASTA